MRRKELAVNLAFQLPMMIVLAMLCVATYPLNVGLTVVFYVAGLIDLTYSKTPLFRHRIFNSFGPRHLPTKRREAYFRGYKRIAFGAALNLLSLMYYSMMLSGS